MNLQFQFQYIFMHSECFPQPMFPFPFSQKTLGDGLLVYDKLSMLTNTENIK